MLSFLREVWKVILDFFWDRLAACQFTEELELSSQSAVLKVPIEQALLRWESSADNRNSLCAAIYMLKFKSDL